MNEHGLLSFAPRLDVIDFVVALNSTKILNKVEFIHCDMLIKYKWGFSKSIQTYLLVNISLS